MTGWRWRLMYANLVMSFSRIVVRYHPIGQLIFYHGLRHAIAAGVKRTKQQTLRKGTTG